MGIQEQFAGFLRHHVINPKGEFYDPQNFDIEFHTKMARLPPSTATGKDRSGTSSKKTPVAGTGKDGSGSTSKKTTVTATSKRTSETTSKKTTSARKSSGGK